MLLWIAFALLTAAVLAWVLAPLGRPVPAGADAASAEAGARAVYRDQLAEIETEHAQGLIGAAEAEAAKNEISRRLLTTATPSGSTGVSAEAAPQTGWHANLGVATAAAVLLVTLPLYFVFGSPGMPSAGSLADADAVREQAVLMQMIGKVEERLREAPDDGRGWEVIAPVYLKLGRFADAAVAYGNAARLLGESPKRLAGFAEAAIFAHDGIVTEEARAAYEKLVKIDPGSVAARFWLAVAKEQDGRLGDALADYRALLQEAPPDAAYRPPLETRIAELSEPMPGASAGEPPRGPAAGDIEAAAKLSPEARERMVAGMVDGLARRLKSDGKDLPGWQRLIKAYSVLGRNDDARAALAEARRNFAGDPRSLTDLSRLAATLGLGS
jgi:cytochrome c-type biogenesis protein CcmH